MTVLAQRNGQIQRLRDITALAGQSVATINSSGDIEVTVGGNGFIVRSPNGTRWRIVADNDGNMSTAVVT